MTTERIVLLLVLPLSLVLLLPCHAQLQDDTSTQDVCKKCHTNATCLRKNNTYSCICNYGLIGNGRTHCLDKDECQIGSHKICGDQTACHNTHGSFFCVCLDGYRPSNNHRHFIPNDGTFCTDIDECESADICGYKGKCKNTPGNYECYCMEGYQLKSGTEPFQAYGDIACVDIDECEAEDICGPNAQCKNVLGSHECYCMEGYKLNNGMEPFQATGHINVCSVVDCGLPPALPHTQMDLEGNTTFGSRVTYRCDPGFTANAGHDISICTSHGTWKGDSLVCTVIDCGLPPILPNMLINSSNNTTFGSNVTYRCMKGYGAVSGNGVARCTQNGKWEAANLSCQVVDCGQPPSIQHASSRFARNTTLGNNITYECMSGYVKQSGNGITVCNEDGKWDGVDLICKEINCGQPTSVSNAQMILSGSTNLGSKVEYECLRGFYNSGGRSISRCTENGKWEDVNITCKVNETLIGNMTIFNETCLQWRKSSEIIDWEILYKFTILGKGWDQEHFAHERDFEFITNNSFRCLDLLPGRNYMVIMRAVFLEMQEIPINITLETAMMMRFGEITLFNTTCLQWAKSSGKTEVLEEYTVLIKGHAWNPQKIFLNILFNFSTSSRNPVLCLLLPSEEEYIINVTESSTELSASVPLNTSGHANSNEDISGTAPLDETCLRWYRIIDDNGMQEIYRTLTAERNNTLRPDSYHMPNTIKGIPKGQFLRVRRISSSDERYLSSANKLINKFVEKGYDYNSLCIIRDEVLKRDRTSLLRKTKDTLVVDQRIPFVSQFGPLSKKLEKLISQHWSILQRDPVVGKHCKAVPLFSYKRGRNLADKLVKTDIYGTENKTRFLSTPKFGTFPCLGCGCCSSIIKGDSITHPLKGYKIP
ncbi:sushi domain-containing protein 1 isoform X2 [Xenopus laevis]|uniref:Sushi domain-containing protein 1 isoform X2 n=1 Tax=Xenopus laevis TaxID=8355 RepID=A0A8J1M2I5_XENLA|nr:sushi domain-containing protein 1 isoform X2 [Xenopus laevis]